MCSLQLRWGNSRPWWPSWSREKEGIWPRVCPGHLALSPLSHLTTAPCRGLISQGRLLRLGHLAHSSPNCTLCSPDEVSSLSSLLVMPVTTQSAECFLLGDGLSPAPHSPDPDPRTESIAALTRSSPLPLKGSSGFRGIHVQVILTSAPSETLRAEGLYLLQREGPAQGTPHTSGGLFLSSHSTGPA